MAGPAPSIAHINLAPGYRGGERQTELLIRALADSGWRQCLVARRDAPLAASCAGIDGLEIRPVRNNVVSGALALGQVDLVHVHEGRAIQAAWLNRVLRGTPYLVTRRVQKGPRVTPANRRLYGGAKSLVAVSAAIVESLHRLDPALGVCVVPDATSELTADPDEARRIRARVGGDVLVGNVAALVDSHKGQRQIIALARRLHADHPHLVFLLVGGGEDEAALRQEAQGLDNLQFAGQVDNVGDYLAAMDVFFYPSRHEGLGSVLLDAMAFGLPIVATNVGGIPEIVEDGADGWLCAVDDLNAQERALLSLAADPELRQHIGQTNRRKAEHFRPAEMARAYAAIYRQLLDRPLEQTSQ
jgi:glycosyltransferase involved in cell wall biosynthesis